MLYKFKKLSPDYIVTTVYLEFDSDKNAIAFQEKVWKMFVHGIINFRISCKLGKDAKP